MSYVIELTADAKQDLEGIKKFNRQEIIDTMKLQLVHEPTKPTRNRKVLVEFQPDFEHDPPVWRLRVGEYRVYYDVNESQKKVFIRRVRQKPPHATAEEIL